MGFSSVCKALQEIFPEVDARLLRAVAIEHPKDADHAVEVVLTEVIPYMEKSSDSSGSRSGNQSSRDPSIGVGPAEDNSQNSLIRRRPARSIVIEDKSDSKPTAVGPAEDNSLIRQRPARSIFIEERSVSSPTGGANHSDATSHGKNLVEYIVVDEDKKLTSFGKSEEVSDEVGLDHVENVNQQGLVSTESEKLNPMEKAQDISVECLDEKTAKGNTTVSLLEDEHVCKLNNLMCENFDQTQEINQSGVEKTVNGNTTVSAVEDEDCCKLNNLNCEDDEISAPQLESCFENSQLQIISSVACTSDAPESCLQHDFSDCQKSSHSYNSNQDCSESGMVSIDDEADLLSRSVQISGVDLLEGIIEEAKNNKKTLFSAMESVITMMEQVEMREKAAEQAKEEAMNGGSDILLKAKEIKEMLVHAKEANDMHAGEVYGEKSILATEVKELQSRLLILSDERDCSLAILNEMRETLEARLASAEEMMRAALIEKQRKEESALNVLAEQEAIMEKVVQESKMLQQEAEENSKLQEFLINRGHVVDMLQGEISVICQDVRTLKEKFDQRLPLSQSFTSSQTTCKLASSGSSLKSAVSDLDIEHNLSKTPKTSPSTSMINGESPKSPTTSTNHGESPKSGIHKEDRVQNDHKSLLDDGWDWL